MITELQQEAIALLKNMIETPSLSREEEGTAQLINDFLESKGVNTHRLENNVYAYNKYYDESKPTILLNSHHDTVKPNAGYTKDPFSAIVEEGKLYGLGSNDAGGCLVSLIATFLYFYDQEDLKYNFVLAATAEEEISGRNGLELTLPHLDEIDFAIVGEPTQMDAAIAEKGLMVLDCVVKGKSGHAAREEGENALYKALKDIQWFKDYEFERVSDALGKMKMSVTVINSGTQHNVVPDTCSFVVDVRVTDAYENLEVVNIIKKHVDCEVTPRSTRLTSSGISIEHSFVQAAISNGAKTYGSPTMSDQALFSGVSVKMGPGKSERSHTADEFIYLSEIEEGIEKYIANLSKICS
ncbi:MAG: M20 family metallo-hydrolase [Cytophagales bacterium]|nr:M20 family metallo-hydrolase [Cytophagales bacterium]